MCGHAVEPSVFTVEIHRSGDRFATAAAILRTGVFRDAQAIRPFLVGGGPDHVVGIDTAGSLAAPIFELPKAIAGLRRIDPKARQSLVRFLVQHREVMSYTA